MYPPTPSRRSAPEPRASLPRNTGSSERIAGDSESVWLHRATSISIRPFGFAVRSTLKNDPASFVAVPPGGD